MKYMIMNRLNYVLIFLLFTAVVIAQDENGKRADRVEAKKIAYISNTLDLTPDEAKVFWPIYNEHKDRVSAIKSKFDLPYKIDVMSDKELEDWVNNSLEKESYLLEEKKSYVQELKKVISIRKIALLYKSEKKFRKRVLKEVKKRIKKKERKERKEKREKRKDREEKF